MAWSGMWSRFSRTHLEISPAFGRPPFSKGVNTRAPFGKGGGARKRAGDLEEMRFAGYFEKGSNHVSPS
jgi:hypothetical protein